MSSILTIAINKVKRALDSCKEELEERAKILQTIEASKSMTISIDLCDVSKPFLRKLMEQELSPNQRRMVAIFTVGENADIKSVLIGSPKDLHTAISSITDKAMQLPNIDFQLNNRWYPGFISTNYQTGMFGEMCALTLSYKFCDIGESMNWHVTDGFFTSPEGEPVEYTFLEVMDKLGLRPMQTDMPEFHKRVRRADQINSECGKVFQVTNNVVVKHAFQWWAKIESVEFGSPMVPMKVVVENELERNHQNYYHSNDKIMELPFIRCFSLDTKKYVYVDVDDIEEYKFDVSAIDRLVLPEALGKILRTVFTAKEAFFGDVIKGKHGGMIIMANGATGVGKTLTAEVFAEHTERPLYVMEMGELGTDLASVEQNLQRIFIRAARWRAVLLFDEADVFMAKRDQNLERSAIVGVFLRLLDYYKGLLFLTTNRADVIDDAFKSRITLKLDYPQLNRPTRLKVWEKMLAMAKVTITDGIDGIPDVELNGRQIRNMVRLIKVIHPDGQVTSDQVKEICKYSCA